MTPDHRHGSRPGFCWCDLTTEPDSPSPVVSQDAPDTVPSSRTRITFRLTPPLPPMYLGDHAAVYKAAMDREAQIERAARLVEGPRGLPDEPIRLRPRLRHRLRVYFEPRDVWVGAYVAKGAVYVCPLPCVVIRWQR